MTNSPERTCIVCRKKGPKENFIKIVKNKNGEVSIEKQKKLDGRGAYICKNEKCFADAKKKRALNRVFKMQISDEIYEEIANERELKKD